MSQPSDRYLAFVDYLGTEILYRDASRNADAIVERRNELEHGVQILLQPFIAARKIEIGLFSDTVLIAGLSAADVIHCSALLLRFVLKKSLDRERWADTRLLRGGFAKGIELRTSYLRNGPGVHVIPFFDGSLSFSYRLEGVRRGSRLFFPDKEDLGDNVRFVFPWKHLSGVGDPVGGVHEFMWPAYLYQKDPLGLAEFTRRAFTLWRRYTTEERRTPEEYRNTLYHFDETVKCLVRSLTLLSDAADLDKAIGTCVEAILPSDGDLMEDCNIRFLWGFWFQMLLAISLVGLQEQYVEQIALTKRELVRRDYFDRFMAETEYPEYASLRDIFGRT